MPKRIQRSRAKGWKMPEGTVYVGRPTRWGNQFKALGNFYYLHGTPTAERPDSHASRLLVISARHAVELYRERLKHRPLFHLDIVRELRGKDLACWCPLAQPCHADVLLEIANALKGER